MENLAVKDSKGEKKSLSKKSQIRVDMTPMVDLGFLLITFFMFTTNFTKPNVMDLSYPPKPPIINEEAVDFRNQITFIMGKENRVFYYQAEAKDLNKDVLRETTFKGSEIAKLISEAKKKAPKPEIFTVIIKPAEDSNYKNFVDMLDNMTITKSELYGIGEIKPLEKEVYEEKVQ